MSDLINKQWIPVTERLPEDDWHRVLFLTTARGEIAFGFFATGKFYSDDGCVAYDDGDIVAWIPLPEPYKK